MHAISSYRGNRPTNKHANRQAITIHCAAASLKRSVLSATERHISTDNQSYYGSNIRKYFQMDGRTSGQRERSVALCGCDMLTRD